MSMTATNELRHMLDKHGVAHYDIDPISYWGERLGMFETRWGRRFDGTDGYAFVAIEMDRKLLLEIYDLTPAQAIEITLGQGECKIEHRHNEWYCTACDDLIGSDDPDSELFIDGNAIELWDFCPYCGRQVKR